MVSNNAAPCVDSVRESLWRPLTCTTSVLVINKLATLTADANTPPGLSRMSNKTPLTGASKSINPCNSFSRLLFWKAGNLTIAIPSTRRVSITCGWLWLRCKVVVCLRRPAFDVTTSTWVPAMPVSNCSMSLLSSSSPSLNSSTWCK